MPGQCYLHSGGPGNANTFMATSAARIAGVPELVFSRWLDQGTQPTFN